MALDCSLDDDKYNSDTDPEYQPDVSKNQNDSMTGEEFAVNMSEFLARGKVASNNLHYNADNVDGANEEFLARDN